MKYIAIIVIALVVAGLFFLLINPLVYIATEELKGNEKLELVGEGEVSYLLDCWGSKEVRIGDLQLAGLTLYKPNGRGINLEKLRTDISYKVYKEDFLWPMGSRYYILCEEE